MPGRFHDRMSEPLHSTGELLRLVRHGGFGRRARALPFAHLVPRATDPHVPPAGKGTRVTWVGHATSIVQTGGRTFLLDPVWSRRLGTIARVTAPGVALEDLPPIDGVLVSHDHLDHLDLPTLRRIGKDVPHYVPMGTKRLLVAKGFTDVTELDWWEEHVVDGPTAAERAAAEAPAGAAKADGAKAGAATGSPVRLTFTPAHHWCRRTPWDTNERLWGGWHLQGPGKGVFFSGDTAYGAWFQEIGRRLRTDIAVLPVGSYSPRWFMRHVHMGPEEAVQVAQELGARHMVPVHWGTFALTREPFLEPIERCRQAWRDAGRRREDLWDLALGEGRAG